MIIHSDDARDEEHSSGDSTESNDESDYSSATGTLYRTGSCPMTRTLHDKNPSSVTNALLDASTAPATRPRTLTLHEFSPTMSNIHTDPTPSSIPWERHTHTPVRKSSSTPGTPTSILSLPSRPHVRRTNSVVSYASLQQESIRGVAPRECPPVKLPEHTWRVSRSQETFPRTKLSSSRRVIEPLAATNENSHRYSLEITRSMPSSPSDHVDGESVSCFLFFEIIFIC